MIGLKIYYFIELIHVIRSHFIVPSILSGVINMGIILENLLVFSFSK